MKSKGDIGEGGDVGMELMKSKAMIAQAMIAREVIIPRLRRHIFRD